MAHINITMTFFISAVTPAQNLASLPDFTRYSPFISLLEIEYIIKSSKLIFKYSLTLVLMIELTFCFLVIAISYNLLYNIHGCYSMYVCMKTLLANYQLLKMRAGNTNSVFNLGYKQLHYVHWTPCIIL